VASSLWNCGAEVLCGSGLSINLKKLNKITTWLLTLNGVSVECALLA